MTASRASVCKLTTDRLTGLSVCWVQSQYYPQDKRIFILENRKWLSLVNAVINSEASWLKPQADPGTPKRPRCTPVREETALNTCTFATMRAMFSFYTVWLSGY